MDTAQKKTLVASITKFLENERKENLENSDNPDFVEGIEVAVQCIKSSFDLSSIDYESVPNLTEVYPAGCSALSVNQSAEKRFIPDEDKAAAEQRKADGNVLVSEGKFDEAVVAYSSAIELDPYNAVYFGNRAAAYSKLGNHEEAIADCERALQNDANYSKAYGRMGFAYASLKNHAKAVECYERALTLEPDNASYKQNLETARSALPGSAGAGGDAGGGMDFMSILNNPQLMTMASQMMQSPHMQQMLASMMGGAAPGAEQQEGEQQMLQQMEQQQQQLLQAQLPSQLQEGQQQQQMPPNSVPSMEEILRMGQQFASQMQATNPDLVASLRQEFQSSGATADDQQQQKQQQQAPAKDQAEKE